MLKKSFWDKLDNYIMVNHIESSFIKYYKTKTFFEYLV